MSNNWSSAERQIQSGSHFGARDEVHLQCIVFQHVVRYIFTLCLQEGKTPLMYACLKGNERIVRLLIERGADPQDVDKVYTLYHVSV